jgi:hypothetical protein
LADISRLASYCHLTYSLLSPKPETNLRRERPLSSLSADLHRVHILASDSPEKNPNLRKFGVIKAINQAPIARY